MGKLVWSVDTHTGKKLGLLAPTEATWARMQNASGAGEASFYVGDRDSEGFPGKYLTEPASRTLVFEEDGVPLYGGIIWVQDYDRDAATVTLTYADPWSIFGKRMMCAYSNAGVEKEAPLVYGPLSLETQVKRVIQQATAGATFELPLVLPADIPGVHTYTYQNYHLLKAPDAIKVLIETKYGPNTDFLPRWRPSDPTFFEWEVSIGVPAPGLLVFNPTAEESGVSGLKVTRDAQKVANHVIATGQGTEADMLTKAAIHGASPYPALVKTVAFPAVEDPAKLQALADAELELCKDPTAQWSFSIRTGKEEGEHQANQLRPGIGVRVNIQGDPWLDDGTTHLLLIAYSGDLSPFVDLQFQPGVVG
ncbi:hypothetical protein [Arthrobacter sp. UYCu712]|uniref:hypothetical protein n=1 Tax=Arthrobacter sp. UYCu712 TaxID=3156340 RepID=UPI003390CE52